MDNISVSEYQMTFKTITKNLFEQDEVMYQKMLYVAKVEEAKKGFVVKKMNKSNRNGTSITFHRAKTAEEFDLYCKQLEESYLTLFTPHTLEI